MTQALIHDRKTRERIIRPMAAGRETLAVFLLLATVVLLAGLRFYLLRPEQAGKGLAGFQIADLRLKNQAPTLYRALLGVAGDVLYLREADGQWPEIARLRQEGLPPFEARFLPAGLRGFRWERHLGAGWVDYYGRNTVSGKGEGENADPLNNSFILRIIDLEAGNPPFPYLKPDQGAGPCFFTQVWINSQNTDYPAGQGLVERGWKWIISNKADQGGRLMERPGS